MSDAEDGELFGDTLELLQPGVSVHRQVRPGSRSNGKVAPQDRRAPGRLDLFEAHDLATPTPKHRASTCGANVAHPVRVIAEH